MDDELMNKRLDDLYDEIDNLQEIISANVLVNGMAWLVSDEYNQYCDIVDQLDFEIDLLELLMSNGIKN